MSQQMIYFDPLHQEKMRMRNLKTGYVKLYRSLMHEWWYKKPEYVHLYQHLWLLASFSDEKYTTNFNGIDILLKPGQLVIGRNKLADQTGINANNIQRILKFFEKRGSITQQTTNTCRLITIVNWMHYQKPEQQESDNI